MKWLYKILKPVDPEEVGNRLVRCSCGRAMWLKGDDKVKRHHIGHQMRILEQGSVFEFIKLKLGLLSRRTFGEWLRDKMEGLD